MSETAELRSRSKRTPPPFLAPSRSGPLLRLASGGTCRAEGEAGFTLPLVIIMIVISLAALSTVALIGTHFRTIGLAEDGERIYYALDAAVEAVVADLVRGADPVLSSYATPTVALNDVTVSVTVSTSTAGVATPTPNRQYFDPGVTHPELLNPADDTSYILHLLDLFPSEDSVTSELVVNWSFDLLGATSSVDGVRVRIFNNKESLTPGENSGCPTGGILAQTNRGFSPEGSFSIQTAPLEITTSEVYTIAFCVSTLVGTFITNAFIPDGQEDDTWVLAVSFRDYQITASAEGASVTTYVRQVPGRTQPPSGDWADDNISWITNQVTPYQWDR